MKKTVLLAGMLFAFCGGEAGALAQTVTDYTAVRNVHSHNDYCQNLPFYTAYSARCASIEADIFAVDGELYVAHERKEIDRKRTLRALYLDPIRRQMELNGGKAYPDGKSFQLLIDLKTGYAETMPILEKQLEEYLSCFDTEHNPSAVQIVITGNQRILRNMLRLSSSTDNRIKFIRRKKASGWHCSVFLSLSIRNGTGWEEWSKANTIK